jgi:hypothetical protein
LQIEVRHRSGRFSYVGEAIHLEGDSLRSCADALSRNRDTEQFLASLYFDNNQIEFTITGSARSAGVKVRVLHWHMPNVPASELSSSIALPDREIVDVWARQMREFADECAMFM